jgi:hypothetical protein
MACHLFAAWLAHPDPSRFTVMVDAARHAPYWTRIDITRRLAHAEHLRELAAIRRIISWIKIDCA